MDKGARYAVIEDENGSLLYDRAKNIYRDLENPGFGIKPDALGEDGEPVTKIPNAVDLKGQPILERNIPEVPGKLITKKDLDGYGSEYEVTTKSAKRKQQLKELRKKQKLEKKKQARKDQRKNK